MLFIVNQQAQRGGAGMTISASFRKKLKYFDLDVSFACQTEKCW